MCGIFGYFCLNENKPSKINLINATNTLKHRGPDNFNYYENENKSYIFLGHQRLAHHGLAIASLHLFYLREYYYEFQS